MRIEMIYEFGFGASGGTSGANPSVLWSHGAQRVPAPPHGEAARYQISAVEAVRVFPAQTNTEEQQMRLSVPRPVAKAWGFDVSAGALARAAVRAEQVRAAALRFAYDMRACGSLERDWDAEIRLLSRRQTA